MKTPLENRAHPVGGRGKLAYAWIDSSAKTLLDIGCDDGNGVFLFSSKVAGVWGVDINEKAIALAKKNFPQILFSVSKSESLPFGDSFFDTVIMSDVLEHVDDEKKSLNEIFRVLKSGGQLIITVPHQGMFAFLDPANHKFNLSNKKVFKFIFKKWLYKKINTSTPTKRHRHYTLKTLTNLIKDSAFANHFQIEKVFRSGFLFEPLGANLKAILRKLVGKRLATTILMPLFRLATLEYRIPFGPLAYDMAITIRKT